MKGILTLFQALITGSGTTHVILPMGIEIFNNTVLFCPQSNRNLLRFNDSHSNGFHIETEIEGSKEYLYLTT